MIIWTGWGILVPVIAFGAMVVTALLSELVGITNDYVGLVGLILGAIACWFVGKRLNDPAKDRLLLDETSGENVLVRKRHTLFWIEFQWWAVPCLILAVALFFQ